MLRSLILVCLLGLLAACSTPSVESTKNDPTVQKVAYKHNTPASVSLITIFANDTGHGGHSAIVVNGSQRVIFDPAGSYRSDDAVRRYDVVYGVTPRILQQYLSYHARETHHALIQEIVVPAEVAERMLNKAMTSGLVLSGLCTTATAAILRSDPYFSSVQSTLSPRRFAENFGKLPGVKKSRYYENDEGQNVN